MGGILGVFALLSEFTGVAAIGELFGLTAMQSCVGASVFLIAVVFSGDYAAVERVGLCLGGCLSVFVLTAVLCRPKWEEVGLALIWPHFEETEAPAAFGELVLANIGSVVTPWMLFYQSSAI